jgi:hypothetical protein
MKKIRIANSELSEYLQIANKKGFVVAINPQKYYCIVEVKNKRYDGLISELVPIEKREYVKNNSYIYNSINEFYNLFGLSNEL